MIDERARLLRKHTRLWLWAVVGLGAALSIFFNIMAARPTVVAQLMAVVPPLALLVCIEIVSRISVASRLRAAVRVSAAGSVAGIAAWMSYWHMVSVAIASGEAAHGSAHVFPICVDGLMVVASVALVEVGRPDPTQVESVPTESPESEAPESSPTPESGRVALLESGQTPESGRVGSGHSPGSVGSPEAGPVGTGRDGPTEPAAAGTRLHSVGRVESTESSNQVDRVAPYVRRVKEAVESGVIDYPIVKEQIQRQLKIGRGYTDAAVRQIQEEGWSPTWHQSQGSRARAE